MRPPTACRAAAFRGDRVSRPSSRPPRAPAASCRCRDDPARTASSEARMTNGTERPAFGRRQQSPFEPTPTYYGLPSIKPSHYGWLIVTYFFVGGLAGAAQVIATAADL